MIKPRIDPASIDRRIPMGAPDQWDNYCSPASCPDQDFARAAALCGAPFKRVVISDVALRVIMQHPWFAATYPTLWVAPKCDGCGHARPYMIPAPTLESVERVLGASILGPLLPGSLEIDPSVGADVVLTWGDEPGQAAILVGVLDATNTMNYGPSLPTVGAKP